MPRRVRRKPTWGLLDPSELIDGKEAPSMLGRIITDIDSPLAGYAPEHPQDTLKFLQESMDVTDTGMHTLLSGNHSNEVQLRLSQILGISVANNQKEGSQVKSKAVFTRRLRQHQHVFDKLMQEHKEEILKLLSSSTRKRGYLIVGLKTCVDAEMVSFLDAGSQSGGSFKAPLSAIVAAFGIPVPENVAAEVNPSVNIDIQSARTFLTRFVATGERIFSLQLREVKYSGWFNPQPQMMERYKFENSRGTFGSGPTLVEDGNAIESKSQTDEGCAELTENEKATESMKVIFGDFDEDT